MSVCPFIIYMTALNFNFVNILTFLSMKYSKNFLQLCKCFSCYVCCWTVLEWMVKNLYCTYFSNVWAVICGKDHLLIFQFLLLLCLIINVSVRRTIILSRINILNEQQIWIDIWSIWYAKQMDDKLFKFEEKFVLNISKSDCHRTRIDLKVCSLVFFLLLLFWLLS